MGRAPDSSLEPWWEVWEELWRDSLQVGCEVAVGGGPLELAAGRPEPLREARAEDPRPWAELGERGQDAGTGGGVQAEALGGRLVRGRPWRGCARRQASAVRASWPCAPPARPQPRRSAGLERENDEEIQAAKEKLKYWQRLRHDLERARLLIELLRKREKLKREQVKVEQMALELRLTPLTVLLRSVLDQLQEKDPARIFAQPVSLKEVPDYLDHIKRPMDFATMRKRLEAQGYRTLRELEEDFDLIVDNCMKYNAKDTVFYRAAVRLRDQGGVVLRQARRQADSVGFDEASGMHLPERPPPAPRRPFSWDEVDRLLNPANRAHMVLEEQLRELLDMLDLTCAMKSSGSRSKRAKLLKKEIAVLRSKLSQQHSQPPAAESGTAGPEEDGAPRGQEAAEEARDQNLFVCSPSEVGDSSAAKKKVAKHLRRL
ncbi:hypothetical protein Celaphus_00013646 [Cervus elaphus hippelaphus]|uniref:Bromo domain-containing protein n=1 Tax=Cervus elaphus hippelaphus TaxID=46360 RepID=A0A212CD72_CEREH|nr:hypothetical protein Celaphus_00013646 [Cervus elaphus hippelaphus]